MLQDCLAASSSRTWVAGGCALCTDWTGGHLRDTCPFTAHLTPCGIPGCGLIHNNLLHGTNVKFVNTVILNHVDRRGELLAPSSRELKVSGNLLALLQVQTLRVRVQGGQGQDVAFWDAESSVHLMRKKFAVEAATATREVEAEGAAARVAPAGEKAPTEEATPAAEVEAAKAEQLKVEPG